MNQKTVAMTFDDAVSNHATLAAPLLKKYHFNATFFVCEFPPDFATNKQQYMTWEQIKQLSDDGFEIGNHTLHHIGVINTPEDQLVAELRALDDRFQQYGIPQSVSFAYPGGPCDQAAMDIVGRYGFKFARSVAALPYRPGVDQPLNVPSFPVHDGDDSQAFYKAVAQADAQSIPVLLFHGIPEYTHPWVNTVPEHFETYLKYLADNHFRVIALRDLPTAAQA